MKCLLLLLILVSCRKIKGVLEWTVIGKVTDYGQDVTLFCNVTNCCPKDSGWDRWTPVQRTLFIDVKSGRSNKKYNGQVFRDGYTLVIKNLTKDDLNVSYSCLYGVTIGEIKFLLEEDVFKYISTAQPDIRTGNSSFSKGEIAGILIGAVIVVAFPVVFVTIHVLRKRKKRKEETKDFDSSILLGEEVRRFVRINVIGKDRVGKTSLVRTLLGKDFKDDLKSTDGIDINRTRQIRVSDGKWTVGEVDTERNILIERIQNAVNIKQKIVSAKPVESFPDEEGQIDQQNKLPDYELTTREKDNTPIQTESEPLLFEMQEHGTETSELNVLPVTKSKEHNSDRNTFNTPYTDDLIEEKPSIEVSTRIEIQTPDSCGPSENDTLVKSGEADHVTEMIIQNKSDIFKYAKKKKKKMTSKGLVECGIWDFAGQKDYYVTHQTFFTPHAIYLVVADIENEIKPINHNENVEFDSIGDYTDFWFDSIHCFCEDPSEKTLCPPVIMVITGIDKVPDGKKTEYKKEFEEIFFNQNKIKHMRGTIHFISNKTPHDKEISSLKKDISDIAKEMNYYTETLPIRWIQLEHALILLKESKEPSKRSYEKWENIEKIAQTYSIEEKELLHFLNYQHRIGNYIFFEDKRDYIILQPDWLIECFRCLVCDDGKIIPGPMLSEWSNLEKYGKLSTDLIEQLFEKESLLKYKECKTHILNVMEKFDIIVKTKPTDLYYMPCMIKRSSTLKDIKTVCQVKDSNCTPWLVLEFEFLPIAIFNHILVFFIRKYTVYELAGHPAIYTGKAVVRLDATKFRLLIISFSRNLIGLQIWNWNDVNDCIYKNILNELCAYIEELEGTMKNNLVYQIKAKCSTGIYSSSSDRYSYGELKQACENGVYRCVEHDTNHKENDLISTWLKYAPDIEKERRAKQIKEKKERRAKQIKEKKKRDKEKLLKEYQTGEKRYFVRTMIVGKESVGKTCLMRRLLKEDISGVTSTDGVDIVVGRCKINIEDGKWIIDKGKKNMNKKDIKTDAKATGNAYASCELWDFAGQKEFYATHQAFLTSSAVYLVVADMKDDISEQGLSQCFADFQHIGEYVGFWFDSIHCYRTTDVLSSDGHFDPPIILVFTGKDKYDEADFKKRKNELFDQILKVFGLQNKRCHLRDMFYLSNVVDTDEEFEKLRYAIYDNARKTDNWGKSFPLKWVLLENLIETNKINGQNFINFNDMSKLAEHPDINILEEDELLLFLRFQHNVGKIIFFENIRDLIILNPQWLAYAFRCLVSDRIYDRGLHHLKDWKLFTRQGKISESLITKLFESKDEFQFSGQKHNLNKVMEKLDILVKIENSSYYIMPSQMPSATCDYVCEQFGIRTNKCQRTSWLCFKFEFLPPSFFNHLSAWFMRNYNPSKLEAGIALYRGVCMFDIDPSGCEKILVTMSTNTIALQVWSFSEQQGRFGSTCSVIYREVKQVIEDIKERYKVKISFKLHFKCSNGYYYRDTFEYEYLTRDQECYCPQHMATHLSEQLYSLWMKSGAKRVPDRMKISTKQDDHNPETIPNKE